jgi:hypothetical protein
LSASLIEELQAHRARQAAERLSLGMGRDPDGLVFARMDGDPIQLDSVAKMSAGIVERAKITPVSFHALRHNDTTELPRAGVYPKITSERHHRHLIPTPFQACRRLPRNVLTRHSGAQSSEVGLATRWQGGRFWLTVADPSH